MKHDALTPLVETLDAVPRDEIPAAIARLAARAMDSRSQTYPSPRGRQRCLTTTEVAARLGVHRRWIYNHADELGALHLSRRKLVIPEANVEQYLERMAESNQS